MPAVGGSPAAAGRWPTRSGTRWSDTQWHHALAASRVTLGAARTYGESLRVPTGGITRFLIMTSGRSGSELLVSLLASHPEIACDGEILARKRLDAKRFIDGRTAQAQRNGLSAYGLKLQPQHLHDVQRLVGADRWLRSLHTDGWHLIRIRRRNRLQQAVSMLRAQMTQWHLRAGESAVTTQPLEINPLMVVGTMYFIERMEFQIDQYLDGLDYLDITYEANLRAAADQELVVKEVCRRLGVTEMAGTSDLVPTSAASLRELVTNYDELAAEVRRSRFAEFLTE